MLRRLLGFGSELMLSKIPDVGAVILSMRDIYKAWADAHLPREEENIAEFSYFLASDAGAPLRIDGIQWIAGPFAMRQARVVGAGMAQEIVWLIFWTQRSRKIPLSCPRIERLEKQFSR